MNWANIGKIAVRMFTSMSVSSVIQNAIDHTTPEQITKLGKISVKFGGFVIAAMVGDAAGDYVVGEVDTLLKGLKKGEEPIIEAE